MRLSDIERVKHQDSIRPGDFVEVVKGPGKGLKGKVVKSLKGTYHSPFPEAYKVVRVALSDGSREELYAENLRKL